MWFHESVFNADCVEWSEFPGCPQPRDRLQWNQVPIATQLTTNACPIGDAPPDGVCVKHGVTSAQWKRSVLGESVGYRAGVLAGHPSGRPEYECRPLKKMFTMVKLNMTAEKPTMASQALRDPRQPRVERACR